MSRNSSLQLDPMFALRPSLTSSSLGVMKRQRSLTPQPVGVNKLIRQNTQMLSPDSALEVAVVWFLQCSSRRL